MWYRRILRDSGGGVSGLTWSTGSTWTRLLQEMGPRRPCTGLQNDSLSLRSPSFPRAFRAASPFLALRRTPHPLNASRAIFAWIRVKTTRRKRSRIAFLDAWHTPVPGNLSLQASPWLATNIHQVDTDPCRSGPLQVPETSSQGPGSAPGQRGSGPIGTPPIFPAAPASTPPFCLSGSKHTNVGFRTRRPRLSSDPTTLKITTRPRLAGWTRPDLGPDTQRCCVRPLHPSNLSEPHGLAACG